MLLEYSFIPPIPLPDFSFACILFKSTKRLYLQRPRLDDIGAMIQSTAQGKSEPSENVITPKPG